MKSLKFFVALLLIFLVGCSANFRSPFVFKKTSKKEERAPRPEKIVPPPPLNTSKAAEKSEETATEAFPAEEPTIPEEVSENAPEPEGASETASETVETTATKDKTAIASAKTVVILAPEYLKDSEYKVLEKIIVKDISGTGFNKQEAREALQLEALRRFGSQAKGITNVTYGEKSGSMPGSSRVSEVSGEVITWEGKTPKKLKAIEKETKPEPEKEQEPLSPSPETNTDTKTSAQNPVADPQTKPEPSPPSAPAINEQQIEQ